MVTACCVLFWNLNLLQGHEETFTNCLLEDLLSYFSYLVIHLDYLVLFFSFFLLHHKQPYLGEKSQDRWAIDPKEEKIFLLRACLQLQHEQSRLSQSDDPAWAELAVPQGHRENQREFTGALREPRVQKYRGEFLGQRAIQWHRLAGC